MYGDDVRERICQEIAAGRSLRSICEEDGMPDKANVFRWLSKDEGFRDQYARAREAQADAMLEEILEIADQWESPADLVRDPDMIQRAKLRIDTRKWAMGKLASKRYGDKIDHNVEGNVVVQLVRFGDDPPTQ